MAWGRRKTRIDTDLPHRDKYLEEHPNADLKGLNRKNSTAVAYSITSTYCKSSWGGRKSKPVWYKNVNLENYIEGKVTSKEIPEFIKKLKGLHI